MFQLTEFTQARVASVSNRTEKHGDEDVPAVTIFIEIETANTLLDSIDPSIRQALYKAVDDQPTLDGVETTTPVLRCNSFDTIALTTSHEGWRLFVDDGIDESKPMLFSRVKVDKLRVDAKQGGSILLKVRMGTSDIDAERLGKLGMHNGQDIWVKLLKPETADQPVIDGSTAAFKADHPEAQTAGDLFAAEHGPAANDGQADDTADQHAGDFGTASADEQDLAAEAERGDNVVWPFPTPVTARADDGSTEQAELEAGIAQSIASAGLKPKAARRPRRAAGGAVE